MVEEKEIISGGDVCDWMAEFVVLIQVEVWPTM